jgi:hypothetical protein
LKLKRDFFCCGGGGFEEWECSMFWMLMFGGNIVGEHSEF